MEVIENIKARFTRPPTVDEAEAALQKAESDLAEAETEFAATGTNWTKREDRARAVDQCKVKLSVAKKHASAEAQRIADADRKAKLERLEELRVTAYEIQERLMPLIRSSADHAFAISAEFHDASAMMDEADHAQREFLALERELGLAGPLEDHKNRTTPASPFNVSSYRHLLGVEIGRRMIDQGPGAIVKYATDTLVTANTERARDLRDREAKKNDS